MWRRDIWRADGRDWSRARILLAWWWHHVGHLLHLVWLRAHCLLHVLLCLVTPPRVWVVVDSGVTGELVGATEALRASLKSASVWLLAGMCSNVSGLMLKAVECLIAEWALVWSWQVWPLLAALLWHVWHHALRSHLSFLLLLLLLEEQ